MKGRARHALGGNMPTHGGNSTTRSFKLTDFLGTATAPITLKVKFQSHMLTVSPAILLNANPVFLISVCYLTTYKTDNK